MAFRQTGTIAIACAVLFLAAAGCGRKPEPPKAASSTTMLFLDDFHIARQENIERVLETPSKHPANPLIVQEHPWEARYVQVYGNAIYDPEWNKFRMWYSASASEDADPEMTICYAESDDGIHWIKPMVGTADVPQYKEHNIVINGGHGFCVLRDEHETDPQKRYKGLGGDIIGHSPDGLNWSIEPFDAAGKNDTSSSWVFWKGKYLAFVRQQAYLGSHLRAFIRNQAPRIDTIREVALSKSADFSHWDQKETIFTTYTTQGEYPWIQPYGMAVSIYHDLLLGQLWMIDLERMDRNYKIGKQYGQLAISRDGEEWTVLDSQKPFMETSTNSWDIGRYSPAASVLTHNDQMYFYYTSSDAIHGQGFGKTGIGLATLPLDRITGMKNSDETKWGMLETKPLAFSGQELILNAETNPEGIEIECLDHERNPLAGYSREATSLQSFNKIYHQVSWLADGKRQSLSDLKINNPIILRIWIKDGALYSIHAGLALDTLSIPSRKTEDDHLKKGLQFFNKGQFKSAIAHLNQFRANEPNHVVSLGLLSMCHLRLKETSKAVELAQKAIQIEPTNSENHYFLALAYLQNKEHIKAIESLNQAVTLNGTQAKYFSERGFILAIGKLYDLAIEDYQTALSLNPNDAITHNDLGMIHSFRGDDKRAIESFSRALSIDPNYQIPHVKRGVSALQTGQYDLTIKDMTTILDLDPMSSHYYLACAYSMKSQTPSDSESQKMNRQKAFFHIQQAIEHGAKNKKQFLTDRFLQTLKNHPRFIEIMDQL